MGVHTAEKIISIVTVQAADRPAAVAIALVMVSEAPTRPAALPSGRAAGSWQSYCKARCLLRNLTFKRQSPWPLVSLLPIAANSWSGQVLSRSSSRVRSPGSSTGAVVLRSQTESPITLNVVTALGTMLAGIGAVWVVLFAGPRYRLLYGPLASKQLPDGSWRVGIYLSSRGRRDITRNAFDEGKPVELNIGVRIRRLDSIWTSEADVRIVNAQAKETCLLVGPGLINRRQDLRFTVIAEAKPTRLTCQAYLINVSVREKSQTPRERLWVATFVTAGLFLGVAWLVIAVVRSFEVRIQDQVIRTLFSVAGVMIGVWTKRRFPYPDD